VFVDGGSHIALTRTYARAPKGERVVGSVLRNRGENLSLIAALSAQEFGAEPAIEEVVLMPHHYCALTCQSLLS